MLNRKLLEVLQRLRETEKNRLQRFLHSPYFSNTLRAGEIARLYDHIMQYNADEKHPALAKAEVFHRFFPGKQFKENEKGPLDSLTTELFQLVRQFLSQQEMELEHGEYYKHIAMARFYRKNAYEERFWQTMKALRKDREEVTERDAKFYFDQLSIEQEELSFRGLYNSFEDDANLFAVQKNLDLFYSILKIQFSCLLEYQRYSAQIERTTPDPLLLSILDRFNTDDQFNLPVNQLYKLVFDSFQVPLDENILQKLNDLLEQYELQISWESHKDLRAYQRFFIGSMYQKTGNDFWRQQVFEVHQQHLGKGYFYINDSITSNAFFNLVVLGLRLKKFDWVKQFLDSHSSDRICGTRYPAEVHSLGSAEYYFALKSYDKAEQTLNYRLFENPTMSIQADLLLVKIYYETESDLLEPRMRALDQKIRRTNFSQTIKERYLNFLRKLDKIIKYGHQPQSPKKARLIEEIKTIEHIVSREWLLEKLR